MCSLLCIGAVISDFEIAWVVCVCIGAVMHIRCVMEYGWHCC